MTLPAAASSLIRADALHLPLADGVVDLIVTSPPYFALRSYTDGGEHYDGQIGSEATPAAFLEALWAVTAECRRVLKPSGSMFVNLGDKYAGSGGHNNASIGGTGRGPSTYNKAADVPPKSLMGLPWRYAIGCVDDLDLILRAEIVWSKPNGLPESVTDRVRRSHEQWFHFTKSPRYYAAVDEVREPHTDKAGPPERMGNQAAMNGRSDGVARPQSWAPGGAREYNPLGKLPGSVWTIEGEDPVWEAVWSGPIRFCPRCGRDLRAGSGPATRIRAGMGVQSAQTAPSSTSTASPTSSSSDPSPAALPSTTCVETEGAATPPTSKSSPGEPTSNAAASLSKPTASTGTASTTPTSTDALTASAASAAHATRDACVCDTLDWPPSGPPSVWTVPSEPLRVPEFLGTDHFAAFPQELPRRLILGWSPSGICTACGEGRAPVVEKEYRKRDNGAPKRVATYTDNNFGGESPLMRDGTGYTDATITGYACGCPDPSAPTRPAVVLDPFGGTGTVAMVARMLGRFPVHVDLSADYLRLARWRIFESGHATKTEARTNRERQGTLL